MKTAIAYLRFSSPAQQYGDSLRRQNRMIDEWLQDNPEYRIDSMTYQDLGLSAFHGDNVTKGAFSSFMYALERGYFPRGTVLLVESLDRISREQIGEATDRLRSILKAGVDVVTLADRMHYTSDSLNDPYALIKAIIISQRANEESAMKSQRIQASWEKKRHAAVETGQIMTRRCPGWLRVSDDRFTFEVIDDKAAVIQEIFSLRLSGMSFNAIAINLNDRDVKTMTDKASQWCPKNVQCQLRNKAVIGTYSPSRQAVNRKIADIEHYYPSIITPADFEAASRIKASRFGPDIAPENPWLVNLFKSVMKCKVCGHAIILSSVTQSGGGYYTCTMHRLHRCAAGGIGRAKVDEVLIKGVICNISQLGYSSSLSDYPTRLRKENVDLLWRIGQLTEAVQIAPEVEPLATKLRELYQQYRNNDSDIKAFEVRFQHGHLRDIAQLDLSRKADRLLCQQYICAHVESLYLDTEHRRCDVRLRSGLTLYNLSLNKIPASQYLIDALSYVTNGALFF